MASVARKRNSKKWRARYRLPDGREKAKEFDRKIDGERWLTEVLGQLRRGEYVDPALGKITIGEWSETWLKSKAALKPTARRSYAEVYANLVAPRWERVPLAKVTFSDAVTWLAELSGEKGLSASRCRHGLMVLKQLLDLAVLDGRLARNLVKPIKAPRVVRSEPRFATHAQLATLAAGSAQYEVLVLFLGYTGLRWGEARALRVRSLDLMRGRVHVSENLPDGSDSVVVVPKSHRRRTVPVPAFVRDLLMAHTAGMAPDDLVFTNSRGGLLHNSNFRRGPFARGVEAAGLAPFTPHDLRHTAASLAVSSGANVKVVQSMLGHASAAMTLDVYASLWADDLDDVAARMNAAALAARAQLHSAPIVGLPTSSSAG